jgi:transposase
MKALVCAIAIIKIGQMEKRNGKIVIFKKRRRKKMEKDVKATYQYHIGIDVGKCKLDLYDTINNEHKVIKNEEEGIIEYINYIMESCCNKSLDKNDILIVIDLTGGYEKLCCNTLYNNNFKSIVLAEGFKVKNFSKSTNHNRAKTDKMDCRLLIEYGKYFINELNLYEPQEEDRDTINQLYGRLEDMKNTQQREKNRLKQPNLLSFMKIRIKEQIEFTVKEIKLLKEEIKRIITNNKELSIIYNTLISRKGVKDELSLFLITKLKELGKIQKNQLSSLCGLAPIPFDSGSSVRGHRYTKGGRREVKSKLYFTAFSMIRYDTQFQNKMEEFVKRGKNKKIALVALARKLIIQLNAMVRNALRKEGFVE